MKRFLLVLFFISSFLMCGMFCFVPVAIAGKDPGITADTMPNSVKISPLDDEKLETSSLSSKVSSSKKVSGEISNQYTSGNVQPTDTTKEYVNTITALKNLGSGKNPSGEYNEWDDDKKKSWTAMKKAKATESESAKLAKRSASDMTEVAQVAKRSEKDMTEVAQVARRSEKDMTEVAQVTKRTAADKTKIDELDKNKVSGGVERTRMEADKVQIVQLDDKKQAAALAGKDAVDKQRIMELSDKYTLAGVANAGGEEDVYYEQLANPYEEAGYVWGMRKGSGNFWSKLAGSIGVGFDTKFGNISLGLGGSSGEWYATEGAGDLILDKLRPPSVSISPDGIGVSGNTEIATPFGSFGISAGRYGQKASGSAGLEDTVGSGGTGKPAGPPVRAGGDLGFDPDSGNISLDGSISTAPNISRGAGLGYTIDGGGGTEYGGNGIWDYIDFSVGGGATAGAGGVQSVGGGATGSVGGSKGPVSAGAGASAGAGWSK